LAGAYSTNSAVALANSPPIEMPCTTRPSTMMMGAAIPMVAKAGVSPSVRVPNAIITISSESARRRP